MIGIIVAHLREMAPRSITGELRRDLMGRRIHAVSELPYRCRAPLGKRWHRPLLILLILTPTLQLRPMLCRPPSQMVPVVTPKRLIFSMHRDQQVVIAGPDGEYIGTRPLVLRTRQPRRHLDHHSVAVIDRQFAGNGISLDDLTEGRHLPPELWPTFESQPVAGVCNPHADDGLVGFNGGVPSLARHRERGRIAMRGQRRRGGPHHWVPGCPI